MSDHRIPRKLIVLLTLILTSALVWGDQKKGSSPPPKPAPAKPAARPATNTSKPATNARPANNTGARPMTNTGARPTTNTGVRPTTNTGMRPTTNTGGRPTTNTGVRPTTNAAGHPATNAAGHPATNAAGHPATNAAGHPATNAAGHPATNAAGRPAAGGAGGHSTVPTRTTSNVSLKGGGTAQVSRAPNGRIAEVHANGMTIHQGLHGGARTVVAERNGRTIYANGHGGGYVQRPYLTAVAAATISGLTMITVMLTRAPIAGTTTMARASMGMLPATTTIRAFTVGPTTLGCRRFTTARWPGAGLVRLGGAPMADSSLPIRCTPRPDSG